MSAALRGCPRCGLVQRVPAIEPGHEARCARCGHRIQRAGDPSSNRLCAAIALAALLFYPLGISLPVIRLEQLGHIHESNIWSGCISLMTHGQLGIGLVVLVCSIIIPVLKLVGLLVLSTRPRTIGAEHQARMYRWIEIAGRWGMIDVLLVAVLIAAVKLGDLATVSPGPGVLAFGACVLLSLIASAVFNPHAIWEDPHE
ncbi:MAG: paraquat-inducible protein A [Planctomycetes bacterium]|nr:paraquat-inducible protein A [Planctomycetota bacterium]